MLFSSSSSFIHEVWNDNCIQPKNSINEWCCNFLFVSCITPKLVNTFHLFVRICGVCFKKKYFRFCIDLTHLLCSFEKSEEKWLDVLCYTFVVIMQLLCDFSTTKFNGVYNGVHWLRRCLNLCAIAGASVAIHFNRCYSSHFGNSKRSKIIKHSVHTSICDRIIQRNANKIQSRSSSNVEKYLNIEKEKKAE